MSPSSMIQFSLPLLNPTQDASPNTPRPPHKTTNSNLEHQSSSGDNETEWGSKPALSSSSSRPEMPIPTSPAGDDVLEGRLGVDTIGGLRGGDAGMGTISREGCGESPTFCNHHRSLEYHGQASRRMCPCPHSRVLTIPTQEKWKGLALLHEECHACMPFCCGISRRHLTLIWGACSYSPVILTVYEYMEAQGPFLKSLQRHE